MGLLTDLLGDGNATYLGNAPAGMYQTHIGGSSTTVPLTAGSPAGCWIYVPATNPVDRIGIEVATAGAVGDTAKLYLYKRRSPTTDELDQVLDAGTIDTSSTGFKEITIAETLEPGAYAGFVVGDVVTGSPAVRAKNGASWPVPAPEQAAINDQRGGFHAAQLSGWATPPPTTVTWVTGSRAYAALVYLRSA